MNGGVRRFSGRHVGFFRRHFTMSLCDGDAFRRFGSRFKSTVSNATWRRRQTAFDRLGMSSCRRRQTGPPRLSVKPSALSSLATSFAGSEKSL